MGSSIANITRKIKSFTQKSLFTDILAVFIILFTSTLSFGLGRLSVIKENRQPVLIKYPENDLSYKENNLPQYRDSRISAPAGKTVLASKNGTKYYFINCSGADRIKPENIVWFTGPEDAEKAGLTKSSTCKI